MNATYTIWNMSTEMNLAFFKDKLEGLISYTKSSWNTVNQDGKSKGRAERHHDDKDSNINVIASVTIPALRQKIFQCNPFPNFWIKIPIISIVNTCINNSFYLCTTLHPKTTLKYYDNVLINFKVYAEIKMGIACEILFFYQWILLD